MNETEDDDINLPALIDRARRCLAAARTSAEVLEAHAAAQAALHYAKLVKAANETQGDCLKMIARAEIRMANEIDAAQARGEVAKPGGDRQSIVRDADNGSATFDDLDLDRRRVAEWRQLRDAGGEPLVERVIQGALSEGQAPKASDIRNEVRQITLVTQPPEVVYKNITFVTVDPETAQQEKLWWAVRHRIFSQENMALDPVKAAAAVPEDQRLWIRRQVARQTTWLSRFTNALIKDPQRNLSEDSAPAEENARSG